MNVDLRLDADEADDYTWTAVLLNHRSIRQTVAILGFPTVSNPRSLTASCFL